MVGVLCMMLVGWVVMFGIVAVVVIIFYCVYEGGVVEVDNMMCVIEFFGNYVG